MPDRSLMPLQFKSLSVLNLKAYTPVNGNLKHPWTQTTKDGFPPLLFRRPSEDLDLEDVLCIRDPDVKSSFHKSVQQR